MEKKDAVIQAGKRSTKLFTLNIDASDPALTLATYILPLGIINIDGPIGEIHHSMGIRYFIFQTAYRDFDRASWTIYGVDSQHLQHGAATHVIDGNKDTFWNTEWTPTHEPLPHWISIDMGETHKIHGFRFEAYRTAFRGQMPKDITISFSSDGHKWRDRENFTLHLDKKVGGSYKLKEDVYLSHPVTARYFKVFIHTLSGPTQITDLSEIYAF